MIDMKNVMSIRMTSCNRMRWEGITVCPLDQILFKRTDKGWVGYKCSKDLALPKRIKVFKEYEIEDLYNKTGYVYRDMLLTFIDGLSDRVVINELQLHEEKQKTLPFLLSHIIKRHKEA